MNYELCAVYRSNLFKLFQWTTDVLFLLTNKNEFIVYESNDRIAGSDGAIYLNAKNSIKQ